MVAVARYYGAGVFDRQTLISLAVLCVLAVVAELLAVEFAEKVTVTVSNLPVLLGMMFLGPEPAMIIAAVAGLWGCWREESARIAAFNVANYVLPAGLGALVFASLQSTLAFPIDSLSPALLASGAAAALTYEVINLALAGIGSSLSSRVSGRTVLVYWRAELRPFLQSVAVLTGLGLMVAALYAIAGIVAVALLFAPLFASQYMFQLLVREKEHLARQKKLTDQYLEMNIGLAAAMIVLLDSKDQYTARHSAAVAMYSRDMAEMLGLPEQQVEALHLAGLLHDLGKVGTPDAILGKPGTLDNDEWEYIREHPMKGAEVLSHLVAYRDVADIVQYHHERLDGSGYPLGVRGEEIPEPSKILAVADCYHAMTSDRPYRRALSSFEALKVLRASAGASLERRYVEALAQILRDKNLAYRDGTSTDFMGEYERGRISLKLRGAIFQDPETGLPASSQRDPAIG
jgi:putative nucleotidyltransferase with HDIG domain